MTTDKITPDNQAVAAEMREFFRGASDKLFRKVDSKDDAYAAIRMFMNRISKVIEGLAERGALTNTEANDYSFSSCGMAALLYALEHNPIFDEGVFKDQLMHQYDSVMRMARARTIDTAEKGG